MSSFEVIITFNAGISTEKQLSIIGELAIIIVRPQITKTVKNLKTFIINTSNSPAKLENVQALLDSYSDYITYTSSEG
jgi:hypothetical protein